MILLSSIGIYLIGILMIVFSRLYLKKRVRGTAAENVLQGGIFLSVLAVMIPVAFYNFSKDQVPMVIAISAPVIYILVVIIRNLTVRPPTNDQLKGLTGESTKEIDPEYGAVRLYHNGKAFFRQAYSDVIIGPEIRIVVVDVDDDGRVKVEAMRTLRSAAPKTTQPKPKPKVQVKPKVHSKGLSKPGS